MNLRRIVPLVVLLGLLCTPLAAQEEKQEYAAPDMTEMMAAMEKAGAVTDHHRALEKMAGDWDVTMKMWMDPDADPVIAEFTATSEMILGGRFLVEEVAGDFMGQPFEGYNVTGYNNVTGEYEAVWLDNMSTALMRSTGSMNEAGDEFASWGTMVDPLTGEEVKSRGVVRIMHDEMIAEAFETRDGVERKTMEFLYKRKM
jgi:hypothetical protein